MALRCERIRVRAATRVRETPQLRDPRPTAGKMESGIRLNLSGVNDRCGRSFVPCSPDVF